MLGSSAPYVVTLLVSVLTWTITSFFSDMSQISALLYSYSVGTGQDDKPYIEYKFKNISPRKHLANVFVSLDCADRTVPCFQPGQSTGGQIGQTIVVPPWSMTTSLEQMMLSVRQEVDLPVDQSFAIRATLVSSEPNAVVLLVSYGDTPGSAHDLDLVLTDRMSANLFVARNYVAIISVLWASAALLLLVVYLAPRRPQTPKQPEEVRVTIARET